MRDIRFRAWDKTYNKMHYNVTAGGLPQTNSTVWSEEEARWLEMVPGYILMQYTGLKDKNGKEIYEGDILETQFDINDIEKGWRFEVAWCEGNGSCVGFWLYGIGEWDANYPKDYSELAMLEFHNDTGQVGNPMWEVIGNIFENGDLLDDKNR